MFVIITKWGEFITPQVQNGVKMSAISGVAAARIWALGEAFCHGWVTMLSHKKADLGRNLFLEICQKEGTEWQRVASEQACLIAESMQLDVMFVGPKLCHTTGSGTLSWNVAPDGKVVIVGRVPSKTGYYKDNVIVRLVISNNGDYTLKTFGKFPGKTSEIVDNWGWGMAQTEASEFDYTWAALAHAAKACGINEIGSRPVDVEFGGFKWLSVLPPEEWTWVRLDNTIEVAPIMVTDPCVHQFLHEGASIIIYGSRVAGYANMTSDLDVAFSGCSRSDVERFLREHVRIRGKNLVDLDRITGPHAPGSDHLGANIGAYDPAQNIFIDIAEGTDYWALPGKEYAPFQLIQADSGCVRPPLMPMKAADPRWLSTAIRLEALGLPTPPYEEVIWNASIPKGDRTSLLGLDRIAQALNFRKRHAKDSLPLDSKLVRLALLLLNGECDRHDELLARGSTKGLDLDDFEGPYLQRIKDRIEAKRAAEAEEQRIRDEKRADAAKNDGSWPTIFGRCS